MHVVIMSRVLFVILDITLFTGRPESVTTADNNIYAKLRWSTQGS